MTDIKTRGVKRLAIERLIPHPDNPRKDLGDISELTESIRTQGVFQNLTVTPAELVDGVEIPDDEKQYYVVVIGHRRLAAAKAAGLTDLPCMDVRMDRQEQISTMLLENMQRSDLTYYEQAQGFQMMLDMGNSVPTISKRTGFSETTVRRRLKMAELDPEKLREISGRQLSLSDFDELAKVEDLNERNALLEMMGTRDFEFGLNRALKAQTVKKNLPAVKEWLKKSKAKKIERSDTWSSKYDRVGSYIYLSKWGEEGNAPPTVLPEPLFYYMDDDSLQLFKKHERAKPIEKTPEEIAYEKAVSEAWKALDADSTTAYELRKAFIDGLLVTNKNRDMLWRGALWAAVFNTVSYSVIQDRKTIRAEIGLEEGGYISEKEKKTAEYLEAMDEKDLPVMVYALFGDSEKLMCVDSNFRGKFPNYNLSVHMNLLYDWLVYLGYEMSSMEISLMNGSHPSFSKGDADGE